MEEYISQINSIRNVISDEFKELFDVFKNCLLPQVFRFENLEAKLTKDFLQSNLLLLLVQACDIDVTTCSDHISSDFIGSHISTFNKACFIKV